MTVSKSDKKSFKEEIDGSLPVSPRVESTVVNPKTDFISIATHQLKTPLAGNKWALNFLISGSVGALSSAQKELLEKIYESNERAIRLVNDMLRADREESEVFQYTPQEIDLLAQIQKIITETMPAAIKKSISLEFTKSKDVPMVFADPEKMNYVFENLLDNSVLYTREGGSVSIHAERDDGAVVVSIKDSGIGIPLKDQDKLFNKFFRAVNARKSEGGGTGLGLYITKRIIEEHGGRIWFQSKENEGTTFRVALPIAKKV